MNVLFLFIFKIFVHNEGFKEKVGIKGPDVLFPAYKLKIGDGFKNGFMRNELNKKKLWTNPVIPKNDRIATWMQCFWLIFLEEGFWKGQYPCIT